MISYYTHDSCTKNSFIIDIIEIEPCLIFGFYFNITLTNAVMVD